MPYHISWVTELTQGEVMNRTLFLALMTSVAVAGTMAARLGFVDPPVNLQATTPGTQQIGNTNISGKALSSSFSATNSSPTAQVIVGNATSTTGANYAGLFRTDSSGGTGIRGAASATTGNANGGTFQSASPSGAGVRGFATAPSGTNYGVYGQATSPSGFAGYFQGALKATGTISGNGSGITNVNADLLDGLNSTAFLQAVPNPLSLTGSNVNPIVRAENLTGPAVFGWSKATTGTSNGGFFQSDSPDGTGMSAVASASTGSAIGVFSRSLGSGGVGVEGWGNTGIKGRNTLGSGPGVMGTALSGNIGVFGQALGAGFGVEGQSDTGSGVYGFSSASGGTGGTFSNNSASGTGIGLRAVGGSADGFGAKITGQGIGTFSESVDNDAMQALANAPNRSGIWARNIAATFAYGVVGEAAQYGVYGNSGNYAVYGNSVGGYGVYANGDLGTSGNKQFRIDHPSDPEHKYLIHYASESPYPQNFYSGNVVTDAQGYAWVTLPDYFADINTNFKYQLTVIGRDFAQAIISEEIQGNRFQVRTNAPQTKVSWRVEADRNDLYNRKKQPRDVVDKPADEIGTYQMPDLYGKGADRTLGFRKAGMEFKSTTVQANPKAPKSR